MLLALTGPATEMTPGTMSPAEFRARLAAVRRKGRWAFARLFWGIPLCILLLTFQPSWLGIQNPPFWFWIVVGVLYLSLIYLVFDSWFRALRRIDDSAIRCPHCGHLLTDDDDAKPLLGTGLCPRCGTQVLDAIDPRYA